MYLYRLLNDCDIVLNPKKFGLFGKKTVSSCLEYNYYFLCEVNNYNYNFKNVKSSLIYNSALFDIISLSNYNEYILKEYLCNKIPCDNKEKELYFKNLFKTALLHLRNGNNIDTNWISFSKNLSSILDYCNNQNNNHVAVINSDIKGIFDDDLLALDLSNDDAINKIKCLFVVDNNRRYVSNDFIGFNYSKKSEEIIYYNHIPKDRIVAILDPFVIDLILNDIIDENIFYSYSKGEQDHLILYLKNYYILNKLLSEKKYRLIEIFNLLYKYNISFEELIKKGYSYDELSNAKTEIFSYLSSLDMEFIKSSNKQKVLLPKKSVV